MHLLVCQIIQGFYVGTVDIYRLNYVLITLITKVKGAERHDLRQPLFF